MRTAYPFKRLFFFSFSYTTTMFFFFIFAFISRRRGQLLVYFTSFFLITNHIFVYSPYSHIFCHFSTDLPLFLISLYFYFTPIILTISLSSFAFTRVMFPNYLNLFFLSFSKLWPKLSLIYSFLILTSSR